MRRTVDRREFLSMGLRLGAAAWAGTWIGTGCADEHGEAEADMSKSRVIVAREDALFPGPDTFDRDVGVRLLDSALMKLLGADSPAQAWGSLFKPRDVVGIKVNCLAGPQLSSHPGLVDAIVDGLRRAGVSPSNIYVWDRLTRELAEVGFRVRKGRGSVRCFGTDDLPRGGYESEPFVFRSVASRFSQFVSRLCTALVNVPVLKDHDIAGVSIGMKNFLGAVGNPNKYHDNHCNPYIADLSAHPLIRNKLRLIVCDAGRVQYDGGPSFKPGGAWEFRGLLLARDPVALDAVGLRLIEEKRAGEGKRPLAEVGRPPEYIASAAKLALGVADPSRIDLVEL